MQQGGSDPPSAMAPTEDAIQALMEHLVYPLLPNRASSMEVPKAPQQEAVAKQMHAVVLLYNYYHRKQFPQLEFLCFESFCKIAVTAKPSLSVYMKFMRRCKEEAGDFDKQLSITESMIMDACNICTSLDASKDAPNMESWPISKVAVFLVDVTKQKCLLQFCMITQGVWSLVERDLDMPFNNLLGGPQMKMHASKEKRILSRSPGDKSCEMEDVLHQLALSVVNEKTGIDQSTLSVLEHQMTYSLCQEKTATRIYIMTYTEAVNTEFVEIPIKDVLSSLRGPLFKRGLTLDVTPVVEYFHLLPYINILSDWLSRETLHAGPLHVVRPHVDVGGKFSLEPDREPIIEDYCINDKSGLNEQVPSFLSNKMSQTENKIVNKKEDDPSLPLSVWKLPSLSGGSSMDADRLSTMGVQAMNDNSFSSVQTMDISSEKNMMKSTAKHNKGIGGSCTSVSTEAVAYQKADNSLLNHHQQVSHPVENIKSRKCTISEAQISKRQMTSNQVGVNVADDEFKDKAAVADPVEKTRKAESIEGEPLSRTVISDSVQDRTATCDLPLVPLQFTSENHDTLHLLTAAKKNDMLQAALRVLYKKRDELCQKQYLLGDEVARCEMNIQTVLNGGEEDLPSNVELIIEACNDLWSGQMQKCTFCCFEERSPAQRIKRKRLSEAVLSLCSPCQELENVCRENSWILPRYCVFPSFANGVFEAKVTVQGMDFDFTVGSDPKSGPREARESAASLMLNKLRSMAGQAQ